MTIRRLLLCLGLAVSTVSASLGALASSRGGALKVNGVHVLTIRTGGASARAASVAKALQSANSSSTISVQRERRAYALRLGNRPLVTVTKAEALAGGSTPSALAHRWATNLRSALTLPPVKVLGGPIKVPAGGSREVKLVGSKTHLVKWRTLPAGSVEIKRTPDGCTVWGRQLGQATVIFEASGADADLSVEVLPISAHFPQNVVANVSGLPADRATVAGAVEAAIRTQLKTQPAAELKMDLPSLGTLEPGQARIVPVRVRAAAPGAFATDGTVSVAVRNMGLGLAREEALWYSNHPENLVGPGLLMRNRLEPEKPVRLLYHHINESPQGLYVQVEAANPSAATARVLVIPGDAEPDRNPVLAGIVAGERFLKRWLAASGEVIEIPPNSRVPLALRRLAPKETMSGLCSLWLLEGGPESLNVNVHAQPPTSSEASLAALIKHETPWRYTPPIPLSPPAANGHPFEHIYPDPFKTEGLTHQVGGRHGFVRIGQNPISRQDQNGSLDGNFGVLYRIEAQAENPTDMPTELEVVFEASAGYSGALFVLNNEVIRTPLLQPKSSVRLLRIRLSPGGSKRFDLLTIPLSGSSYPATVMMRPIEAANKPAADVSNKWLSKF